MKRTMLLAAAVLLCLALTACGEQAPTLQEQLETAKAEGCVVTENGGVTAGQEAWQTFCETAWAGDDAEVRLADWHDGTARSTEQLAFYDLAFDGEAYTVSGNYGAGNPDLRTYTYSELLCFPDQPAERPDAVSFTAYYLADDPELTYEDIRRSETASLEADRVDAYCVYMEYVWRDEA